MQKLSKQTETFPPFQLVWGLIVDVTLTLKHLFSVKSHYKKEATRVGHKSKDNEPIYFFCNDWQKT